MLNVSDEDFERTKAEQEEYERLLAVRRRASLGARIAMVAWLSGVLSFGAVVLGAVPRFRPLVFLGVALMPWFVWSVIRLARKEQTVDRLMAADSEQRRLEELARREDVRHNLMAQKRAQDEIERLRRDIDNLKNGSA